jgi:hypothetical protein
MGDFLNAIGPEYRRRITNVELHWQGGHRHASKTFELLAQSEFLRKLWLGINANTMSDRLDDPWLAWGARGMEKVRGMKGHELDFRVREIRTVTYGGTEMATDRSQFEKAVIEGQQPWNQNSLFPRGVITRFEKKMGDLLRGLKDSDDDGEMKRKTRKKKSLKKQWTRKKRGKGGPSGRTSKAKKPKS